MKKSYNPFKMIGSYLGLLAFIVILLIKSDARLSLDLIKSFFEFLLFIPANVFGTTTIAFSIILWLYLILGFVIGWAIQSIWRNLK